MNIETVPIDSIQLDPANVRRHPTRNVDAIKGSLARFGQQRPLIVDHRNIVIAGNGTLQAARELGWTHIQIVRTALAGVEAVAFSVADNRTSETSEWDQQALADTLAALQAEDVDLVGSVGFSAEEFAALIGSPADDPTPPDEFPAVDENIQTEHQCPSCRYRWSGSSAPSQGAE